MISARASARRGVWTFAQVESSISSAAAEQSRRWEADYEACHRGYATCRFLGQLGTGVVHPEAERIVELHDFVTRCSESLPLA